MAVVQAAKKAAACTGPTPSAEAPELLGHELLLHTVAQRLALGQRQPNVTGGGVAGVPVQPHQFDPFDF